jgi:hypothetical protein
MAAFLLVVAISSYAVVTARRIPRSARGYFGRRLIGSVITGVMFFVGRART